MTFRRFGVLLRRLPRDSEYVHEVGGAAVAWSSTERLIAAAVNELRILDWHYLSAHSKTKPSKPTLVQPPEAMTSGAKPKMSIDEMRSRLNDPRWRDVGEAEPVRG